MLPQLLVSEISLLGLGPRWCRIEGRLLVGLVNEEENRDDEDSQDDQPLTHDNLYKWMDEGINSTEFIKRRGTSSSSFIFLESLIR